VIAAQGEEGPGAYSADADHGAKPAFFGIQVQGLRFHFTPPVFM
jgi:hypothetical protein